MLQNILSLKGASILKKEQQESINGGYGLPRGGGAPCNDAADCRLPGDNPFIPWACIGGSCNAGG